MKHIYNYICSFSVAADEEFVAFLDTLRAKLMKINNTIYFFRMREYKLQTFADKLYCNTHVCIYDIYIHSVVNNCEPNHAYKAKTAV